jgi:hypothetical protein
VTDEDERSEEACPACGAHRLTLVGFPDIDVMGYQPYSELIGMGDVRGARQPGIGCLECGAEWESLGAFRQATGR